MNLRPLTFATCIPLLIAATALAETPATTQSTTTSVEKDDSSATVKVVRGSLPIRIDGEAVFEPVNPYEVRLKPKVFNGEMVIKSVVTAGTRVNTGDVLFEIDDKPIRKEITTAENELEMAKANFAKAQSDSELQQQADDQATKMAEDDVKNAADALKWFDDIDGPQMLQLADLTVMQNQYALDDKSDELDQLRKMYKSEDLANATADIVLKRSVREVELAKIQVERAKEDARKVKTSNHPEARRRLVFTVDQQNNNLKQLLATHAQSAVQRKVALATAKQALTDAEQKLAGLQADATQFKQTAVSDGAVYLGQFVNRSWTANDPKLLAVGEKVTANSIVLTVIKPGHMRLAMDLPEGRYLAVKQGMPATIVPAITAGKISGKADIPSPVTKTTGLELSIQCAEVDPAITPGMKASVSIDAGSVDGLLLVPTAAISDSKVWVKGSGNKPVAKHVMIGRAGDDKTEIVDGLAEGDEILEQPPK